MANAKTTKTETPAKSGNRFKIAVGDTLVFETDDEVIVTSVAGVSEKRGTPSFETVQRFNKADIAGLLG